MCTWIREHTVRGPLSLMLASALLLVGTAACSGAGGRGPKSAEALLSSAMQAQERGEMSKARRHWEALRVLAEGSEDAPGLLRAHLAMMWIEAEAGDTEALAVVVRRALSAGLLAKDHRAQARLQLGAARSTRLLGQIPQSGAHLHLAGGHAARAGETALRAAALAGQAEIAATLGDYPTAVARLSESVALLESLGDRAGALAALAAAGAARHLRDLRLARRLAEQALRAATAALGKGGAGGGDGAKGDLAGDALMGLGRIHEEALVGDALMELGRIHEEAGDLAAARTSYLEALERLGSQGRPRQLGLAAWRFARRLEAWGEASEADGLRAKARMELSRAGDRYGVARLELATGRALGRGGKHTEGRPWLERAATALEDQGDRFTAGQARILLAQARLLLGDAAEAIGELTQALDHAEAANAPELTFRAYAELANISDRVLDRSAQAERFHRGAVSALEKLRSALDPLAEGDHGAQESAYYALARVAVRQWRQTGDPSQIDGALAAVERFRSLQLLDVFSRVGASLADSDPERRLARSLAGQERSLAEALERPGGTLGLRQTLLGQLHRVRSARARIEENALRMAAAYPTPVTVGILKQALGDEDAMLVYLTGEHGSLLLALTGQDAQVMDLPPRQELASAAEAFRRLLDGGAAPETAAYRRTGDALRKLVIDPGAALLEGRRRVHLVLTGPLGDIPFAALPDPGGRPLGLRRAFVRVPSPAGWLRLRDTPRGQTPLRALQVIGLTGASRPTSPSPLRNALISLGHSLRPSASALEEGRALAAAVVPKDPKGLLVDPSKAALTKNGLTQSRWVHLATPVVLPALLQGPVQPALVMKAGPGPEEDGLLLLGDLLGMPFDAELLSVAELDSGRKAPSPLAVDTLARTLQIAGVRASLLPRVARRGKAPYFAAYLQALYGRLAAGDPLATAQLSAQQAAWRAHPGDPRPLGAFLLSGAY